MRFELRGGEAEQLDRLLPRELLEPLSAITCKAGLLDIQIICGFHFLFHYPYITSM